MLRAAVVGCGFIGAGEMVPEGGIQSHAAAWTLHPGARLVGLADVAPQTVATAAARWAAPGYVDAGQMLAAERPDVVSVATPDATHVQMLELVLETPSVRAVLVEKPLALEPEVAERIVEHARRRGVLLAVNYSRRFAPSHRRLKAWLAGKPLGTIEMIRGLYVRGIKHNGTHWLDLARYLVGEVIGIRGSGPVAPEQVDATIDVDLRFASGARGHLQGLRGGEYSLFEMDLVGSLGRLQISDSGERFQAFRGQPSRRFPGFQELAEMASPDGGLTDLLLHAATDLTEALENGRAPACSGEDGVIALRLATEALATARAEDRTHAALGC